MVHNRNGGSSNNIKQTFDLMTTPTLGYLIVQLIQGDWTHLVQDLAAQDEGRLNRWEMEGERNGTVNLEDTPAAIIHDNDPSGIVSTISTKDRAEMADDNIIRSYTMATTPDLLKLRGQQIEGAWRLKVADLVRSDVGKLNRWGLRINKGVVARTGIGQDHVVRGLWHSLRFHWITRTAAPSISPDRSLSKATFASSR